MDDRSGMREPWEFGMLTLWTLVTVGVLLARRYAGETRCSPVACSRDGSVTRGRSADDGFAKFK
jgi:hypothetical protein